MNAQEEFDYFDVVVLGPVWCLGGTVFAHTLTNPRRREAANDR